MLGESQSNVQANIGEARDRQNEKVLGGISFEILSKLKLLDQMRKTLAKILNDSKVRYSFFSRNEKDSQMMGALTKPDVDSSF